MHSAGTGGTREGWEGGPWEGWAGRGGGGGERAGAGLKSSVGRQGRSSQQGRHSSRQAEQRCRQVAGWETCLRYMSTGNATVAGQKPIAPTSPMMSSKKGMTRAIVVQNTT